MKKARRYAFWNTRPLLMAFLAASLSMLPRGRVEAVTTAAESPVPAIEFLSSLGVVTHLGYNDGRYASAKEAAQDLDYLGIHQLREGLPGPSKGVPDQNLANSIDVLVKAGNRFDFITEPARQSLPVFQRQLDTILAQHAGAVIAVEGPNEINNAPILYKGLRGEAAARAFQHDLYEAIRADPLLEKIPVYYFTGGEPVDLEAHPGLADYANAHPYAYQGQAPGPRIKAEFKHNFTMVPPYPHVITEAGYFNQPGNPAGSGVDDATQARLTLDLLFDAFRQGVARTFLYQLRSAYPDPHGNSADTEYGLFNYDNSPKPVATAIHNLTTILLETHKPARTPIQGGLAFTLAGLPMTGQHVLMRKPDGTFALVLWAEPTVWNEASHSAVPAATTPVTLSFPNPARKVRIFDPLISSGTLQMSDDANSVEIGLSDHPLVVEVEPAD